MSGLKTVQVAVGVIERRGRYLLSRRKAGDHLGGYWEFPGGTRRAGESGVACLRRELLEELGVRVGQVRRLAPIHFRYPDRHVRLEIFRCAIARGTPQPLDSDAIRWVSPGQLARLRLPPADRPLVERLAGLSHHLPLDPKGRYSPSARREVVGLRRRRDNAIIHMRPKLMPACLAVLPACCAARSAGRGAGRERKRT